MLEFIEGFGILIAYFLICASAALALRKCVKMPTELFRKILHLILLGSIFVFLYAFPTWWISALAAVMFIVLVYPILVFCERISGYSELLTERKRGEIKSSLVIVFGMFAVLICICWGLWDQKYLVLAAVLGWGLGDGAAALIGKRFGRHYLEGSLIEGRKSVEGSVAMFVVSFISIILVMLHHNAVPRSGYIPIAAISAAICSVVELYTKNGMDTLTCPFAVLASMVPLIYIWGGTF